MVANKSYQLVKMQSSFFKCGVDVYVCYNNKGAPQFSFKTYTTPVSSNFVYKACVRTRIVSSTSAFYAIKLDILRNKLHRSLKI